MGEYLKWIADHFHSLQFAILAFFLLVGFITFRSFNRTESKFRVREADRTEPIRTRPKVETPTNKKSTPPLFLPGVRLQGSAHEILGVAENSTHEEIMKAYKECMKRYHPDRIQHVVPDQMKFYQEASAKINEAKDEMISKLKS